jgi:hypothetical protein
MGLLIGLAIIAWIIYAINNSAKEKASAPPLINQPTKFTLRLQEMNLGEPPNCTKALAIQAIGPFPVNAAVNAKMVISVLDATDENELLPVLSSVADFQEAESTAYQHSTNLGTLKPGYGWTDWVRVGLVIPEILTAAYSGQRRLMVFARGFEVTQTPPINLGFCASSAPGLFFTDALNFPYKVTEVGYIEHSERADKATVLTVRLAMAVAMADGALCDTEGEMIKAWSKKRVDSLSNEERAAKLKAKVNQAIRYSYEKKEDLPESIPEITFQLKSLNMKSHCYEAVELCFDVLAADGVADQAEMGIVNEIARQLSIDTEELKRMRDQRLVKVDSSALAEEGLDKFLGIDPDWTMDQKQKHLRKEFQKWNGRLNQLSEGQERESAQKMLDRIAQARTALK